MKEDLKKYFDEIEHLQYSERLPHASLFENKANFKNFYGTFIVIKEILHK